MSLQPLPPLLTGKRTSQSVRRSKRVVTAPYNGPSVMRNESYSLALVLVTDESETLTDPYLEHLYIYLPWGVPPISM